MKSLIVFALASSFFFSGSAQENKQPVKVNLGVGAGIDYGGVGGRLTVSPIKEVFVFCALGYNFAGAGYNIGSGFRFAPNKRFSPYVLGMYGHNTVVIALVDGEYEPGFTRAFTGATFGFGFESRRFFESKNYWNFELLVPLRSQAFKNYKSFLENHYNSKFFEIPVDISIGYHIGFN